MKIFTFPQKKNEPEGHQAPVHPLGPIYFIGENTFLQQDPNWSWRDLQIWIPSFASFGSWVPHSISALGTVSFLKTTHKYSQSLPALPFSLGLYLCSASQIESSQGLPSSRPQKPFHDTTGDVSQE